MISIASEPGISQLRIHSANGKFSILEKAQVKQMQLMHSTNVPINGNFLKKKR